VKTGQGTDRRGSCHAAAFHRNVVDANAFEMWGAHRFTTDLSVVLDSIFLLHLKAKLNLVSTVCIDPLDLCIESFF
jgi:hypothetical protein